MRFVHTQAIIIVVTVAFVQEYRSEKSLEQLNKLVPPTCRCLRNGSVETFLAKLLVPGDVVLLSSGDRVPADVRLFDCNDLQIDESSFTGETEPASKQTSPIMDGSLSVAKKTNVAFMGTLVSTGNGRGIVINTGDKSEFGEIFKLMQSEEAPKTPLQNSMDTLGKQLSFYSFGIIFAIMLLGTIQGRPVLEMFNIGVSLAVAAIPEGLPIVVTVTLALGVMRMAKQNAVIRRLPTVETLGCANVICSDKTGTLTKNEMTLTSLITSELYDVTGIGHNNILLAESSKQFSSIRRLFEVGCVCNNTVVVEGKLCGQPTEVAIIAAAQKFNLYNIRDNYNRLEEIPFSSEQKIMAVRAAPKYVGNGFESLDDSANARYFIKGAIERVLPLCNTYAFDEQILPMNDDRFREFITHSQLLGQKGLRG